MKRRRILIEHLAEEDLREAIFWYNSRRAGLGDELYQEALTTIDRLKTGPLAAVRAPGYTVNAPVWRVFLPRFPYAVVFLDEGKQLRVIAFAHFKRRPSYWQDK